MTDKEKLEAVKAEIRKLHGNPYYIMAVKDALAIIDSLQEEPVVQCVPFEPVGVPVDKVVPANIPDKKEEPVSEELIDVAKQYVKEHVIGIDKITFSIATDMFISGANWQKNHLWKPADGDDLPEIDREVIVLIQDYPDDKDHLRVAFAHRPSKYAKVWNYDLGEEQIVEIERYGKGEWNIPDIKYWLDCRIPKMGED